MNRSVAVTRSKIGSPASLVAVVLFILALINLATPHSSGQQGQCFANVWVFCSSCGADTTPCNMKQCEGSGLNAKCTASQITRPVPANTALQTCVGGKTSGRLTCTQGTTTTWCTQSTACDVNASCLLDPATGLRFCNPPAMGTPTTNLCGLTPWQLGGGSCPAGS